MLNCLPFRSKLITVNHNSYLIQIWSVLLVHQSEFMRAQLVSVPHNLGLMSSNDHFQPLKEGLSLWDSSVDTPEGRLQDHFGRIKIYIIWLKFTNFCSDNLIREIKSTQLDYPNFLFIEVSNVLENPVETSTECQIYIICVCDDGEWC